MGVATGTERITAHDGGGFTAFRALPEAGSGPGVLLFQEIFGVNDNMRGLAVRLAEAGYVVLVPDVFWRIEPGFERKDESGLADGMAMVQQLDFELVGHDMTSTLAHLLGMDACTGKVGAVGFCLGGSLTYLCVASARVDGRGVDAAVPYYGSGIHDMIGLAGSVTAPVMFHYGDRDPYIPSEQVEVVEKSFAGRANAVVHRYDAGHAFSNWDAPSMYDRPAAELAWSRTVAFFGEYLNS
ncbi:dienelactone hydrolase family protein [Pseudonocardia spinosispora]|uniref:dienelactone hydrolase family protein n=1 Tax=Pseudonocardia spinosispora TaxID=103441 RepID=UPI00041968EB|nr:dienelactone hydrolase family protein [Pseudonocardia spinosispora]